MVKYSNTFVDADGVLRHALLVKVVNSGEEGEVPPGTQPVSVQNFPSNQEVTVSNFPTITSIQGSVSTNTLDSGNPVKIGAVYKATIPAYTDGFRSELMTDANGNLRVLGIASAFTATDNMTNVIGRYYSQGSTTNSVTLGVNNCVYNSTTNGWDRQRGDTIGTHVVSKGTAALATGQSAVTTASSQIVAARAGRTSVTIINNGTVDLFIGNTGVTVSNGLLILGAKGASITIYTAAALFAVAASATSVSYMETF